MKLLLALWLGSVVPPDTVTISVDDALARAQDASAALDAVRERRRAASSRMGQAEAWPNPSIAFSAENVGQQVAFTGVDGARGLEGQAVFLFGLPLGPERAGRVRSAQAEAGLAEAGVVAEELSVRAGLLGAIGSVIRGQVQADNAERELATLNRIADALELQAELGRTSLGDAARADLARGMAATGSARRDADLGRDAAELARLLGYDAGTPVRIAAGACTEARSPSMDDAWVAPEVRMAEARVERAEGLSDVARGLRLPDVQPQVGLRRSQALTGLYLGLSTELPFFDRGSRRVDAAEADVMALEAERTDLERRIASARAGAQRAVEALTAGGTGFDARWFANLEQTVVAAEARFEEGEGTLIELLDARRARLQALDDYAAWQAEWWAARVEAARLGGHPVDGDLLCMDPFREMAR